MNKEQIINEISQTKLHLAYLKERLEECEYKRWEPEKGETFYYLNSYNVPIPETWDADYSNAGHYNIYNCFKTREEAEAEAEKILVRRQLENIARRLNRGREIDWNTEEQSKYYICTDNEGIEYNVNFTEKAQGVVYCLDENFKDIAIQEIGEERLKKYLRGE